MKNKTSQNPKVKKEKKINTKISPDDTIKFIENFRTLQAGLDQTTQAISIRVPKNILDAFKMQAKLQNKKYQSIIVDLMRKHLQS